MVYEENMAYFTSKWTSDIVLRDNDSVYNDFSCAIDNWWGGENPGPGVEAEKILQILCSGCNTNLKSGTQCNTCGRWFHNSCGIVKVQVAESGKWICDKCSLEGLRLLEEKVQNASLQTDDLTSKNKALEEQLRLATAGREAGRQDTGPCDRKGGECIVLGNSIIHNVGSECSDMNLEFFPGIRTAQLHRVIKNRDL